MPNFPITELKKDSLLPTASSLSVNRKNSNSPTNLSPNALSSRSQLKYQYSFTDSLALATEDLRSNEFKVNKSNFYSNCLQNVSDYILQYILISNFKGKYKIQKKSAPKSRR